MLALAFSQRTEYSGNFEESDVHNTFEMKPWQIFTYLCTCNLAKVSQQPLWHQIPSITYIWQLDNSQRPTGILLSVSFKTIFCQKDLLSFHQLVTFSSRLVTWEIINDKKDPNFNNMIRFQTKTTSKIMKEIPSRNECLTYFFSRCLSIFQSVFWFH